jgi:heme exporter protein D
VARQCSSVKAGFALSVCVVATYVGVLLLAIVAVVARRSILRGRVESQEMKDLDLAASQGLITSFAVDKEHDAEDIESEKTGVDFGEF